MSIEQWVEVWVNALGPDWQKRRGRGANMFCMARYGDKGPYAVGNVQIVTNAQNASEIVWTEEKRAAQSKIMLKRMADPATRLKCSLAKLGKPGQPHTDETKAKISALHKGKKSRNKSLSKLGSKNPMFGWKWFNDGKLARLFDPDEAPRGWRMGRALRKKAA